MAKICLTFNEKVLKERPLDGPQLTIGRKLDNFRLFSGFTHQDNTIAPANRADFCIIYLWAQIIKRCLKELKIPVNAELN